MYYAWMRDIIRWWTSRAGPWRGTQRYLPPRGILLDSLLAVGVVAVVNLLISLVNQLGHVSNISDLYVIAAAVLAARRGLYPALLASILAFLAYDWFFIPPYHTLTVDDPGEYVALITLLATSVVTGQLLTVARHRATEARALEESDRLKSALVSSVSHELKTPLTTIKASATTLLQETMADESTLRQELAGAINRETDRLTRLVSNLLDMSRLEAGALAPRIEWVGIGDVVADVLERLEPMLRGRAVTVEISELLPETPLDFVLISQVLTNLLDNAVRYSPEGAGIAISAEVARGQLRVRVLNEGSCLPAEELDRIFGKFYRLSTAPGGTGLGLAIARGIVEAHRGEIWAENVERRGVAFTFTIPSPATPAAEGASCSLPARFLRGREVR